MAERLSTRHEVWLISRDVADRATLSRQFGVGLERVKFRTLQNEQSPAFSLTSKLLGLFPPHISGILLQVPAYRRIRGMKLNLFVLNSSFYYLRAPAPKSLFMCMFPWPAPTFPRARWCHWPFIKPAISHILANTMRRDPEAVASYDVITANSEFTAHWIKQRWNRDARVVYSASEVTPAPVSIEKKRVILSVGRYNWDKQQHVLIDAFRTMAQEHADGWELHFVGMVHADSARYHQQLVESAKGLPVRFHYDASLDELRAHYATASCFWLAKGFAVPDDEPERMEHFGNTALEAMSAGCVPIVFDGGGLRETVMHGENGFRWKTIDELHVHTRALTTNEELLRQMRDRAEQVDSRFGVEPFLRAVDEIVDEMLSET